MTFIVLFIVSLEKGNTGRECDLEKSTKTYLKTHVIDSNCENVLSKKDINELRLYNRIDQIDCSVFRDINCQAINCNHKRTK